MVKITRKEQTDYLESRVGIDVYVWGGNGELLVNQLPRLCDMEKDDHTDKQALANTDRVLTLVQKRLFTGVNIFDIRGEDCSGLLVRFLLDKGIIKSDMTANALWEYIVGTKDKPAHGKQISLKDAREGDYVFQGNDSRKWHIGGAVSEKYAIESKNHDEGVCKTKIANRGWTYAARPDWYSDEPTPTKPILTRELYLTDPYMRGDDVRDCQRLLVDKGYNPGVNDGIYGKKTMEAIKDFQIDENLGIKRLGTVGKKTATALGFIWEG